MKKKSSERVNLLRLVDELMSLDEGNRTRVTFKIEGGNVGASMHVSPGKQPGKPSINVYINNNIQGVTSSILVGSQVKMGDPGLRISLLGSNRVICWVNALVVVFCGFVLLLSLFFAQFWPGKGK